MYAPAKPTPLSQSRKDLNGRLALTQVLDHRGLVAAKLDAFVLAVALKGVHRIVILDQQALDPAPVQVHAGTTLLLGQGRLHDRRQTLMPLAAQALENIAQALLQALGIQAKTQLLTMLGNTMGIASVV